MYSGTSERADFSKRLIALLVALGWTKISPTRLAEQFNKRAGETGVVTAHAVRKWLIGEAIPSILASWLQVPPDWLRFGSTIGCQAKKNVASADLILLTDFAQLDSAKSCWCVKWWRY